MKMVNKIGYLSVPISYRIDCLPDLMSDFKKTYEVDILLTKAVITPDKFVKFTVFSKNKSWGQEHFPDGLIHCTITDDL